MTSNSRVVGNAFSPDGLAAHFKQFIVGDLISWAPKNGPRAEELAQQYPMLSTNSVEVKVAREPAHKIGPDRPDKDIGPFWNTIGIVLSGHMRITLHDRAQATTETHDLKEAGDFLAWPGSGYTHNWQCVEDAVVITVRWPEKDIAS